MNAELAENVKQQIDAYFVGRESVIARDLKLNLKRCLTEGALSFEEAMLVLVATAASVKNSALLEVGQVALRQAGLTDEQIGEAKESAAIMAMLNTYYRFRHMVGKDEDYRTAGLRMTALAKPMLGKERFEMLALAVSILNGCESCIRSHEQVLRDGGLSADKIHDLARIAAIVRGVASL